MKKLIMVFMCFGIIGCSTVDPKIASMFLENELVGTWNIQDAGLGQETISMEHTGVVVFNKDRSLEIIDSQSFLSGNTNDIEDYDMGYSISKGFMSTKLNVTVAAGGDVMTLTFDIDFLSNGRISLSNIKMSSKAIGKMNLSAFSPVIPKIHIYLERLKKNA